MQLRLLPVALAAVALAACGGSAPKGPPALVFVSTRDKDYAIFGGDTNGHHVRRLTKEKGDPSTPPGLFFQEEPAWSPDGRHIAFSSLRSGTSHIYVMAADGSGTRQLTGSRQDDSHPSWSPDGASIVFAREGAVFRVPAVGGNARRVGRGLGNAADPAYSPDGKLIAYDYRNPGYSIREIYVMRSDGTGIQQLTHLRQVSSFPAWSADGKRIAFQSNLRRGHFEIYSVRVDGARLRQLTNSDTDTTQPAWSPDGKLIAFSRDGSISTVDASGRVTTLTKGQNNDSSPAWNPVAAPPG
jgi:Tol biopolymer transport system component